ncbi:phage tail tape measure protein, partial [Salmonella enterica subsp. enterica serovar Typhimurium]
LDEQLAVLGQLNRTLGTEASSAYEGFMTGAIEGGKKLGLSFTDATGKMLSMPEMLIKLQGKYGKSLEGNLKAQAELDAAFGDSSAVVKHLYGNVALLQRNITELGGSDGLKRTQEMAGKLVKPWDRFVQILKSVQTVIGLTLIPVLYPVLNRLADMGQTFARWMQLFPNIARVIGYAAMALLGFAAAGAIANIVLGVSKLIKLGAIALWKTLTSVTKIYTATVWIASKAVAAWNLTLKFLRGTLLAVRMAAIMAGIGINLMSWPVLLVIGAIGLLAAGCYLLIKHWDDVQAAVMNTAAFTAVAGVVEWLAGVFSTAWQWIKDGWNGFINLLTGFSPSQALSGMAGGIVSMFDNIWQSVKGSFLKSWNWIVEKLNKIPGVNISLANESPPALTTNTLSTGGELKGIDKGGINKSISNNSRAVTDNSRKINTVNIYPKEMITPGQLMEFQELGV